jgi:cardiolipin synthase
VRLVQALRHAAQRGVDVRVMVAGTTDVPAILLASRAIYGLLLRSGVRLFEWEGFNLEVNVIVEDPAFAGAMEAMFFQDLLSCREITLDSWQKRSLWERGASWAAYMMRDWL